MSSRRYRHSQGTNKLKPITLPYQFIPFAEKNDTPRYHTPYVKQVGHNEGELPRHDQSDLISGTIEYEIQQHSPLALELRRKWENGKRSNKEWFLSGSQIRGRIRTNAEILSHSFPEHVNKNDFYYRDFANPGGRDDYQRQLGLNSGGKNESETKINKVVRAGFLTKIGDRFYVAPAQSYGNGEYFRTIKEHQLMEKYPNIDSINFMYEKPNDGGKKNKSYKPYQYFCEKENLYIYNSSPADSKKTHYLIKPPDYLELLEVPNELTNHYNEMLKRLQFPHLKQDNEMKNTYQKFYDLFQHDEKSDSEKRDGKIVFYLINEGKIVAIGRTPYLKIPTRHNVRSLLEPKENIDNNLDYARALFGFVGEEADDQMNSISAYKSRVRFEPVKVEIPNKKKANDEKSFLLLSPLATAEGMYLKQKINER